MSLSHCRFSYRIAPWPVKRHACSQALQFQRPSQPHDCPGRCRVSQVLATGVCYDKSMNIAKLIWVACLALKVRVCSNLCGWLAEEWPSARKLAGEIEKALEIIACPNKLRLSHCLHKSQLSKCNDKHVQPTESLNK